MKCMQFILSAHFCIITDDVLWVDVLLGIDLFLKIKNIGHNTNVSTRIKCNVDKISITLFSWNSCIPSLFSNKTDWHNNSS